MSNLFTRIAKPFIAPAAAVEGAGLRLVFDVEANGLLPEATKAHCIAIADLDSDQVDAYGPDQIPAALAHLARGGYLVNHNVAGYDLPLLLRLYGWAPAPGCTIVDTLVACRLILPHISDLDDQVGAMGGPRLGKLRGRHSLEAYGARLGIPKIGADITDWSQWTPEMQERCIGDVAICKALWRLLQPDGYSQEAMTLEHRVAVICNRISADGVPFDSAAAMQLRDQWTAQRATLAAQLAQQFPGTNLNSRPQIGALLEARGWVPEERTAKTGQPKISDELLESLPALYPEFAGLTEYTILNRRIAQLSMGKQAWCKHVDVSGRIHGGLIHIGTPHSRAKHQTPNLAQVPNPKKGKPFATECRALFRTSDDWVFVTADQAGLQDRGFAHYLAEFDDGAYAATFAGEARDTHWQTAIALGLVPDATVRDKQNKVHEAIREEGAKRFRYAFLYGVGAETAGRIISDAARAAVHLDVDNDLQQRFFNGATHPNQVALKRVGKRALSKFITATPGLAQLRESLEAHVRQHEWLPGLDGRRVPVRALYTALNYIVTSSEAIICKLWLVRVYDELCARFHYGWDGDVVITLWVHDEIAVCCRPEIADQVGEILVRHAKTAGEPYGFRVPLDAGYKVGRSWAGEPIGDAPKATATPIEQPRAPDPIEAAVEFDDAGDEFEEPDNSGPEAPGPTIGNFDPAALGLDQFYQGLADGAIHAIPLDGEAPKAPQEPPKPPPRGNGAAGNGHDPHAGGAAHTWDSGGPTGNGHGERDTGHQAAFYIYHHADGSNYLGVKRTSTKQFPQFTWTGTAWVRGAPGGAKIPYRLPELIKAPLDAWVLICAGEKDANSAADLGFVATTNPEGERKGAWVPELNAWFAGRKRVAIMEDNDKAGHAHVIEVAKALRGVVADIRIVSFRELPENGDLTDWLDLGHGRADLLARIEAAKPASGEFKIRPKADFLRGFIPPDYLVDGVLQRRFIYSLTGRTGHAKTAIALRIAQLVDTGGSLDGHEVFRGRVAYLVGENPDDVRMRVIGDDATLRLDSADSDIIFIPGVFDVDALLHQVEALGELALIIIDTSAAYFLGDDENSNPQLGEHARKLRRLLDLPGAPCALVLCHPIKHASEPAHLIPRGGGAFLAEVDGNLTAWKDDKLITLHHSDKFRGSGFEAITFRLDKIMVEELKDSRGRLIPTIRAIAISEDEEAHEVEVTRADEDLVMLTRLDGGLSMSIADLAHDLDWLYADGKPKSRGFSVRWTASRRPG